MNIFKILKFYNLLLLYLIKDMNYQSCVSTYLQWLTAMRHVFLKRNK